MRDFAEELRRDRCWDRVTQAIFDLHREPLDDCILQNRAELIELCEFVESRSIRSYLEIGLWTGRLLSTLHRLFHFERVAGCDDGYVRRFGFEIHLPPETILFEGDSGSTEFLDWRRELGPVDLVLIDADHRYQGVRRDFEVNRRFPHRFLAFHDIAGQGDDTAGVRRFWKELTEGHKREIVRPNPDILPVIHTMGIGIWSADERP